MQTLSIFFALVGLAPMNGFANDCSSLPDGNLNTSYIPVTFDSPNNITRRTCVPKLPGVALKRVEQTERSFVQLINPLYRDSNNPTPEMRHKRRSFFQGYFGARADLVDALGNCIRYGHFYNQAYVACNTAGKNQALNAALYRALQFDKSQLNHEVGGGLHVLNSSVNGASTIYDSPLLRSLGIKTVTCHNDSHDDIADSCSLEPTPIVFAGLTHHLDQNAGEITRVSAMGAPVMEDDRGEVKVVQQGPVDVVTAETKDRVEPASNNGGFVKEAK